MILNYKEILKKHLIFKMNLLYHCGMKTLKDKYQTIKAPVKGAFFYKNFNITITLRRTQFK